MKQNFAKAWKELNDEEKTIWEATCKKKAIKFWKDYCKKFGYVFDVKVVKWDAENEWNSKHEKVKWAAYAESNLTPEQKELQAIRETEKKLKVELKAAKAELAAILN
ncbi:MAG: hypothetical protein PHD20_04775 [Clostridia bacterium]|nr:hypothetical protein [Clostridia bacterium]MDD4720689.1 hypothetical protein [Bacteroides sp.]